MKGKISLQRSDSGGGLIDRKNTYTDCCEDILQLVHQCDKLGVVDIDPESNFS